MPEATLTALGLLALRVGLGVELAIHGWPKLKAPQGTAGFLTQIGFKPGILWAWVLVLVELLGGILLILGLLTRPVAALVAIQFLVISFYIKPGKMKVPFTTPQGAGWEWDWLILAMAVALLLMGAGAFGLDGVLGLPL